MKCTLQVVIEDEQGKIQTQNVTILNKGSDRGDFIGLSLAESKCVLKQLQEAIIQRQANEYTRNQRCCPDCHRQRRLKGNASIQYRTLFGIVSVPNQRLYHCGVLGILPPNTAKTAEVPVFTGLQATINFNLAQVSVSSSAFGSKNEQKQATIDSHCR